jgi:chorismate mutase-like protein
MTPDDLKAELGERRQQIDAIDSRLLALLNERTEVVSRIGDIKEMLALPIYEPRREDEVYRNVLEGNRGPLPAEAVKRIFERIIDEMRTVQAVRMLRKKKEA